MKKNAQVWIETVIYLFIGLALIGLILAFVKPKISEIQDKSTLDQSLSTMQSLDNQIRSIWDNGAGNKQIVNLDLKQGSMTFNSLDDKIIYELDSSNSQYTESGIIVPLGNVNALTQKQGGAFKVQLILDYGSRINIQFNDKNESKTINSAPTPYNLAISNQGTNINFQVVS